MAEPQDCCCKIYGSSFPKDFTDCTYVCPTGTPDMTDDFNTDLSAVGEPPQNLEPEFQAWATANGLLHLLADYNLRGAWIVAIRGRVPQTWPPNDLCWARDLNCFTKPNHPNFTIDSASSFAGDILQSGGTWLDPLGTSGRRFQVTQTLIYYHGCDALADWYAANFPGTTLVYHPLEEYWQNIGWTNDWADNAFLWTGVPNAKMTCLAPRFLDGRFERLYPHVLDFDLQVEMPVSGTNTIKLFFNGDGTGREYYVEIALTAGLAAAALYDPDGHQIVPPAYFPWSTVNAFANRLRVCQDNHDATVSYQADLGDAHSYIPILWTAGQVELAGLQWAFGTGEAWSEGVIRVPDVAISASPIERPCPGCFPRCPNALNGIFPLWISAKLDGTFTSYSGSGPHDPNWCGPLFSGYKWNLLASLAYGSGPEYSGTCCQWHSNDWDPDYPEITGPQNPYQIGAEISWYTRGQELQVWLCSDPENGLGTHGYHYWLVAYLYTDCNLGWGNSPCLPDVIFECDLGRNQDTPPDVMAFRDLPMTVAWTAGKPCIPADGLLLKITALKERPT
jgi:hypothetical protein